MSSDQLTLKKRQVRFPNFLKQELTQLSDLLGKIELNKVYEKICSRHKIPKEVVKAEIFSLVRKGELDYTHKPTAIIKIKRGGSNE